MTGWSRPAQALRGIDGGLTRPRPMERVDFIAPTGTSRYPWPPMSNGWPTRRGSYTRTPNVYRAKTTEWRRLVGAGVAAFALPLAAVAEEPAPLDFERALDRCHHLVRTERFGDGEKAVRRLLADFADDSRLLSRLAEVEHDLQVCLFRQSLPPIRAQDLFGDGCTLSSATRKATFEFAAPAGPLWRQAQGTWLFSVRFEGDVELSLEAPWLNRDQSRLWLLLCWDEEQQGGYSLFPGYYEPGFDGNESADDVIVYRSIFRLSGGRSSVLFEKWPEARPFARSRRGQVSAARTGNRLTLKIGSAVSAGAADTTYMSGIVGVHSDSPEALSIEGRIDAAWLRAYTEERLAPRFVEWQRNSYRRADEIPVHLRVAPGPRDATLDELPSDAPPERSEAIAGIVTKVLDGDALTGMLADEEALTLPPHTRLYLEGVARLASCAPKAAWRLFDRLVAAEPEFVAARLARAIALFRLRRLREAKQDLAWVLERRPRCGLAYAEAAWVELFEGDLDSASSFVADAANLGLSGARLAEVSRYVDRAAKGPGFVRRFEATSTGYAVTTDHSAEICMRVAALLQSTRDECITALRRVPASATDARVYVFATRKGYEDFVGDLRRPTDRAVGGYVPALNALAVWVPHSMDDLDRALRSGAFLQYVDGVASDVPMWFAEGYAEFLGSRGPGGVWTVQRDAALMPRYVPLPNLVSLGRPAFLARSADCRVQSAHLVDFLRRTAHPQIRGVLHDYIAALHEGLSQDEANARVLAPVMSVLEREFAVDVGGGEK